MNQNEAQFEIFENARCNPQYWNLTDVGGFRLRHDAMPSDPVEDLFKNSSLYAFECATAKRIEFFIL
jgi:protein-glutamine gamma-glutamyltransferase